MALEEVASGLITQEELDRITGGGAPTTPETPTLAQLLKQIAEALAKGRAQQKPTPLGPPTTPQGPPKPQPLTTTGAQKFAELEARNSFLFGSGKTGHDYNLWVLSLQQDPTDPEFNQILQTRKAMARYREEHGGKDPVELGELNPYREPLISARPPGETPGPLFTESVTGGPETPEGPEAPKPTKKGGKTDKTPGKLTEEEEAAYLKERARFEKMTQAEFLGIPEKYLDERAPADPELEGKLPQPAAGAPVAPVAPSWQEQLAGMTTQDALLAGRDKSGQNGSWVFTGYRTYTDSQGVVHRQPVYRANRDAYSEIAGQSKAQIKAFQKSLGLPETGEPDNKTMNLWQEIVDITARKNMAGQNVTTQDVYLGIKAELDEARRRAGSGGGGGGGGGGNIDITSAKAILTGAMQEVAGREPSDAEVRIFWRKLQSQWSSTGGNMDAGQFATDYVRAQFGGEAEGMAYNQYYEAMLSVLGGGVS